MNRPAGWLVVLAALANLAADAPPPPADDAKALRAMEVEINAAKEKVYATKARVHELEEAVLRGKITGSKALVTFENQAEGFFAFESAEFELDGAPLAKVVRPAEDKPLRRVVVFDGDLPSGEHKLRSVIRYRGSDKSVYRTFTYFKDHAFTVESTEPFEVEYGKTTVVQLNVLDRGYFKTALNERLAMEVKIVRDWGTDSAE